MYRKKQRSDYIGEDAVPCNEEDADGEVSTKHRSIKRLQKCWYALDFINEPNDKLYSVASSSIF